MVSWSPNPAAGPPYGNVMSMKLISDRGTQNLRAGMRFAKNFGLRSHGATIVAPEAAFSRGSPHSRPIFFCPAIMWFRSPRLRARPLKVSFVVERFACLTLGLEQFRAGLRGLENQFGLILAAGLRTAGQWLAQFLGNFVIAFRLG